MARSSAKSSESATGSGVGDTSAPIDAPAIQEDEIHDELPDDLNAVDFVGVYQFPDNKRRRTPAALYLIVGGLLTLAWLLSRSSESALVNRGFLAGGLLLMALGAYGLLAGIPLKVYEADALAAAARHVGFPIGHASAQLGWRGLLSRPTWRILLYSAENPPKQRGLVLIDGSDASVLGELVEENPEDWSQYDDDALPESH